MINDSCRIYNVRKFIHNLLYDFIKFSLKTYLHKFQHMSTYNAYWSVCLLNKLNSMIIQQCICSGTYPCWEVWVSCDEVLYIYI
jgi:hypothetical protein